MSLLILNIWVDHMVQGVKLRVRVSRQLPTTLSFTLTSCFILWTLNKCWKNCYWSTYLLSTFWKRNITEAKVMHVRVCKGKGNTGEKLQMKNTSLGFFTSSNTTALRLKLLASSQLITFLSIGAEFTRGCFTQNRTCKNGDKSKSAFNNPATLGQVNS